MISPSPQARAELAPIGTLRVALNVANHVLVQKDAQTGATSGITLDIARELGKALNVPVVFTEFNSAKTMFDAFAQGGFDVCFLAIDPVRADQVNFTAPYILIEGSFVVADTSPFTASGELDRPGVRISVAKGSAYDLHLTRTMKSASLVRLVTGDDALQTFVTDKLDAAAGIKGPVKAFIQANSHLRLLEPPFMIIRQAVVTQRRAPAGSDFADRFVAELKAGNFVKVAMVRHGLRDATAAP